MSKVAMVIKSKTQPEKREAVRQRYEKHLAPRAQANTAQELVLWCADTMDADGFYLFEVYSYQVATQANAQATWFWDYMREVQPLLAGQPEVALTTPVWAKGLTVKPRSFSAGCSFTAASACELLFRSSDCSPRVRDSP